MNDTIEISNEVIKYLDNAKTRGLKVFVCGEFIDDFQPVYLADDGKIYSAVTTKESL